MQRLRPAAERGAFDHGWLDTRHTFSFGEYRDPRHSGFRTLRVINEDRVAPGRGFGAHPHRDMEILSYVLAGRLEHQDSTGGGSVLAPGHFQRMSAGTGVTHSEFNPSKTEPVHFYQVWIQPDRRGGAPDYAELDASEWAGDGLRLVASHDGADGSLSIHQDARVWLARLGAGRQAVHPVESGRGVWVQQTRGAATVAGQPLAAGDGLAIEDEASVAISADAECELLLFDLA